MFAELSVSIKDGILHEEPLPSSVTEKCLDSDASCEDVSVAVFQH